MDFFDKTFGAILFFRYFCKCTKYNYKIKIDK